MAALFSTNRNELRRFPLFCNRPVSDMSCIPTQQTRKAQYHYAARVQPMDEIPLVVIWFILPRTMLLILSPPNMMNSCIHMHDIQHGVLLPSLPNSKPKNAPTTPCRATQPIHETIRAFDTEQAKQSTCATCRACHALCRRFHVAQHSRIQVTHYWKTCSLMD
jgi:hypothetical protein